jgi:hypothetical protein
MLRAGYFTGTKATGTDVDPSNLTGDESANALDIRFPGAFRFQVGVANVKSTALAFAAHFAQIGHRYYLL